MPAFNGLSLTVRGSSGATKQQINDYALSWANEESANDPDLDWFVFIFDSRDKEFGLLYSDGLKAAIGLGSTYFQLIAPQTTQVVIPTVATEPVDYQKLADECIKSMPSLSIPDDQLRSLVTQQITDTDYLAALAAKLSQNADLVTAVSTQLIERTAIAEKVAQLVVASDEFVQLFKALVPSISDSIASSGSQSTPEANAMTEAETKAAIEKELASLDVPGQLLHLVNQKVPALINTEVEDQVSAMLASGPARDYLDQRITEQVTLKMADLLKEKSDLADATIISKSDEFTQAAAKSATSVEVTLSALVSELNDLFKKADTEIGSAMQSLSAATDATETTQTSITSSLDTVKAVEKQQQDLLESLAANKATDDENQKEQALLLEGSKQATALIKENITKISEIAQKSQDFDAWTVSVKSSFERLDAFLLNEYDQLKVSLESASADAELISSLQRTVLGIEVTADDISAAFGKLKTNITAAEESDEIDTLREKVNELTLKINEMGASVSSVEKTEVVVVEQEAVIEDEFSDSSMMDGM